MDSRLGSTSDAGEIRIWGPPGCGKTTYLARQIDRAVEKFGPDSVMVTSFTRAAASELLGRNLPLKREQVGTLHSHCYRAMDHPTVAESVVKMWNKEYPQFALTVSTDDMDEVTRDFTGKTVGDDLYAQLQTLRNTVTPKERWPLRVRRFGEEWSDWKHSCGLKDFTDLLEGALADCRFAPGNPRVILVDEAQDLTKLQLKLIDQWGLGTDYIMLAGDDDQACFTFCGADPELLLRRTGPQHFRHVLSQSYRVPRRIHAMSQAWVQRLTVREPKEYQPRDEAGEIRLLRKGNCRHPDPIVDDAERYLARGKTVMFLASCGYMLEPLRRVLRTRGLPFHNPYRQNRADWNPLGGFERGTTAKDRLLAFLKPSSELGGSPWLSRDLRKCFPWFRESGVLKPGAITLIERMAPDTVLSVDVLDRLFESKALSELAPMVHDGPLDQCIHWWLAHIPVKKRKNASYPAKVALRYGPKALVERPKIILGTGHSVKGGEADIVYIIPDLSVSGRQQWEGRPRDRDSIIRLAYVMITRARESLIICEAAGQGCIPLARAAAGVA